MSDFICNTNKYIQYGQTIVLPLMLTGLPHKLPVEGITLFSKSEFHVTLIAVGKIIERYNVTTVNFLEKVRDDFCEFTKEHPIEFTGFKNEYRFVTEGEDHTLVVMCDVSNLSKFFDLINKKYDLALEAPPTHVTLYVLPGGEGIYLSNKEDILIKTKITDLPEGLINPSASLI